MNVQIFFTSFIFLMIQQGYFGWNMRPGSDAEVICIGITFLIFSLSLIKNK